jgi:hypothetical protein
MSEMTQSRTTQQPLSTPTSRNNPRDMQQHFLMNHFKVILIINNFS